MGALFDTTCAGIVPPDEAVGRETQRILDGKTKPRRSLGRLEDLACTLASITGRARPALPNKAIVVMAGDHGVAKDGVSAYPPEVTWQMVLNFARGGAAINVLARQAFARLVLVDIGVAGPDGSVPGVLHRRVRPGTDNFRYGPAMTVDEAVAALEHGITIAQELASTGINLIGIGEMGIGNTTAATALVSAFTGTPVRTITGRGTGIDDVAWERKVAIIDEALAANPPAGKSPVEILAALGGFEIAGLAGIVLGAACNRVPVVLDGFIASTAAYCAAQIAPNAARYVIASHRSVEAGHGIVLEALGSVPLFDLNMRLGEGTGAAMAMPFLDAAARLVHDMASFDEAQVTDTGR